jgi:hypothetical protein
MWMDFSRAVYEAKGGAQSHGWRWLLILAACGLLSTGCEEETRHVSNNPAVAPQLKEPSGPIISQRTHKFAN